MAKVTIQELLEAGVHFGHQTRRWNPKMKRFIFDARNEIHIIDLGLTLEQIEAVCAKISETVSKGGKILFVGTKKQAQQAVKEIATETGQLHITERWLGGTLTNSKTVRRSIGRLKEIERMQKDGIMATYGKKEQASYNREYARLMRNLDGIRDMGDKPAMMFVIDVKREHNAVAEARKLRIPLAAVVDTNADPDLVDFPIPANDDAIRSIRLVLNVVKETILEARAKWEAAESKRKKEEEERKAAEEAARAKEAAEKEAAEAAAKAKADIAAAQAAATPAPAPAPAAEEAAPEAPAEAPAEEGKEG
jgi:small subunit ribosomal protein S2